MISAAFAESISRRQFTSTADLFFSLGKTGLGGSDEYDVGQRRNVIDIVELLGTKKKEILRVVRESARHRALKANGNPLETLNTSLIYEEVSRGAIGKD